MDGPQDLGGDDPVGRVRWKSDHENGPPPMRNTWVFPLKWAGRPLFGLNEFFGFLEGLVADPNFQPGGCPPRFPRCACRSPPSPGPMRRVAPAASVLQPTRPRGSQGKRPQAGA